MRNEFRIVLPNKDFSVIKSDVKSQQYNIHPITIYPRLATS